MITIQSDYGAAAPAIAVAKEKWLQSQTLARLWAKDAALWTNHDEAKWLGWLDIIAQEQATARDLHQFAQSVHQQGWSDVVLIGMGGSSLGAEVLSLSFGPQQTWPNFHTLDSTDPDQISTLETKITLGKTLFLVASKSGSTLEPNILKAHFHARLTAAGRESGAQFIAITDPGSSLEQEAQRENFAALFHGVPQIGGRYSVLSKFGLVPAAAMGLDIDKLLHSAARMQASCQENAAQNPALELGLAIGLCASQFHCDKLTISSSQSLAATGAWLEQLVAESTGKIGKGIIPLDGEPLTHPSYYGTDRVFLHIQLAQEETPQELAALSQTGHPVLILQLDSLYDLGALFFLSECATAIAGAILHINPFDQPDVEASKLKTRELTTAYETSGALPRSRSLHHFPGITVTTDPASAKLLADSTSLADLLRQFFTLAHSGDYIALLAFLEQNGTHRARLDYWRTLLRNKLHLATSAQFGPRFLHSTGQAFKGGPNSGLFLTITANPVHDLPVPNRKFSFAVVEQAQALGDFAVLCERGRRALHLHLDELETGLKSLGAALEDALI